MGWFGDLPQAASAPDWTAPAPLRDEFSTGAADGPTALIVDDDFSTALALTALLEQGKLSVVSAPSAYVAIDTLEERDDIGIVLMDIVMPVMDGFEAIAAIRRRNRFVDLPIIAVTAKDEDERTRCFAAGASGFLRKPVDADELLETVAVLLGTPGPGTIEDAAS